MEEINIRVARPYRVTIGKGALAQAGDLIAGRFGNVRAVVVTDDTVNALYGEPLFLSLATAGISAECFVFPHGESSKSPETLLRLLSFLCENEITRNDILIALGGGVVGDFCGFAAAIWQRGIDYVQIPTTLLAMVDSSVGGKTAIDLPGGKNLVGAFHEPGLVILDTSLLATLPREVFADGCAEVIKYGMIGDRALFEMMCSPGAADFDVIVSRCVREKAEYVEADELDKGKRRLLNFGHTVGHAIEAASGFTVPHGHAVAIGMRIISDAAVALGLCESSVPGKLSACLAANRLPVGTDLDAGTLARYAKEDKKRAGDTITLILPETIGKVFSRDHKTAELEKIISLGLDGGEK